MKPLSKSDKFKIAATFLEIGQLLEARGRDQFRARAYRNAARSLAEYPGDLGGLAEQDRLTEIKGIGSAIAAQVKEIFTTGRSSYLERLRAELPPGVIELSRILSLKKIEKLHQALGIRSLADLKAAIAAGRVSEVPGFGAKSEEQLLAAITRYENRGERILLLHASRLGRRILGYMKTCAEVRDIEVAGAIRRWKETVGTIRIVAESKRAPALLVEHFLQFPSITDVNERSESACLVTLAENVRVSFTAVPLKQYAVALHHETGAKAHVEKMQSVARRKGYELTGTALLRAGSKRADSGKEISLKNEGDLFKQLGMQYIPPELREDDGEIELALAGKLPADLLTIADIKGMVHCHTTYSDGRNSVAEMAQAAEAMGMQYITITDHSPTAFYANGVKVDRLMRQWDEISRVQESVKVKLLRGTESDILKEGALDYPDRILEQFDVIIASIHNRYKLDEAGMTRRLLTAMKNPLFKIWGHPLGRLVQRRPPIACRVEEILDAIAASRAAIEINGDPHRLDLEPRWLKEARKRGIKFVVSTDAHSITDLQHLPFGIGLARRAGIRRGEVLNTLGVAAFRRRVSPTHS
ncbi:MAG: polymerase lambda [Acidobacteria bacterium]|nr:polymerase lambda [Acidobacteriota bacterium]